MIHLSVTMAMVSTLIKVLRPDQGFNLDGSLLSSSSARSSLISDVSLGVADSLAYKLIRMRSLDHVTWALKLDNKH